MAQEPQHPHDTRNPALTSWVVREGEDPEHWTVNFSMDIVQLAFFRDCMARLSLVYARDRNQPAALISYYWAEDLDLRLKELGGDEAATQKAIEDQRKRKERNDQE